MELYLLKHAVQHGSFDYCVNTIYKQEKKICQYRDLHKHTVLDLQINMSTCLSTCMPTNIDAESKYIFHICLTVVGSHMPQRSP